MEKDPHSRTHRTGAAWITVMAALLLAACSDGGIEGEHKISRIDVPSQNTSTDLSGQEAKVIVDGNTLTFREPGTPPQTLESDAPITTDKWYTLTDNPALRIRTKFVDGEDYDMVTETKAMNQTLASHVYFE